MQIFLKLFMKHFWIITDTDQSSRLFEPRARMPLEESPLDRQRSDITSDRRQVLYLYSNRMSQYFIMTSIIIVMALFCYSRCILVTLKIMNIVTDMFGYIWLFQVLRAFNWPELPGFDAWKSYCCIHNANCENRTPCVFPGQVWHKLIFPGAVSTGHLIYNAYVIGEHV